MSDPFGNAVPMILLRLDKDGHYHTLGEHHMRYYDREEAELQAKSLSKMYPGEFIVIFVAEAFAITDETRLVAIV